MLEGKLITNIKICNMDIQNG